MTRLRLKVTACEIKKSHISEQNEQYRVIKISYKKNGGWLKTVPTSLRGFRQRDKNFFPLEKFEEDFQAFSGFACHEEKKKREKLGNFRAVSIIVAPLGIDASRGGNILNAWCN